METTETTETIRIPTGHKRLLQLLFPNYNFVEVETEEKKDERTNRIPK